MRKLKKQKSTFMRTLHEIKKIFTENGFRDIKMDHEPGKVFLKRERYQVIISDTKKGIKIQLLEGETLIDRVYNPIIYALYGFFAYLYLTTEERIGFPDKLLHLDNYHTQLLVDFDKKMNPAQTKFHEINMRYTREFIGEMAG